MAIDEHTQLVELRQLVRHALSLWAPDPSYRLCDPETALKIAIDVEEHARKSKEERQRVKELVKEILKEMEGSRGNEV